MRKAKAIRYSVEKILWEYDGKASPAKGSWLERGVHRIRSKGKAFRAWIQYRSVQRHTDRIARLLRAVAQGSVRQVRRQLRTRADLYAVQEGVGVVAVARQRGDPGILSCLYQQAIRPVGRGGGAGRETPPAQREDQAPPAPPGDGLLYWALLLQQDVETIGHAWLAGTWEAYEIDDCEGSGGILKVSTPWEHALRSGHWGAVFWMVQERLFSINQVDSTGATALLYAVQSRHRPALAWLLEQPGIEVNRSPIAQDNDCFEWTSPPARRVSPVRGEERLQAESEGGYWAWDADAEQACDPRPRRFHGCTALHWAVRCADRDLVQSLLEAGADPRRRTQGVFFQGERYEQESTSPLESAAYRGDTAMVQVFFEHDPRLAETEGEGVLFYAVVYGRLELLRYLKEAGWLEGRDPAALPPDPIWEGKSPLQWVLAHHQYAVIEHWSLVSVSGDRPGG